MVQNIKELKRVAKLHSKQFKLSESAGKNYIAKCNGYFNWKEMNKTVKDGMITSRNI